MDNMYGYSNTNNSYGSNPKTSGGKKKKKR